MTENESSSSEIFQMMEELKKECEKTYKNIEKITQNDETLDFIEINVVGFKLKSQKAISFMQQINCDLESYYEILTKKNKQVSKSDEINDESLNETINNSIKTELKESEIVKNYSNVEFTEEQLSYLNKGLDYRPFPSKSPLDEIVVNIELEMRKLKINPKDKTIVRNEIKKAIKNYQKPTSNNNDKKVLSELQEKDKDVCYTKSNDGHKIVIINKTDYEKKINKILRNVDAFELKNINKWKTKLPLTSQQKAVILKFKHLQNNYNCYLLKYLQINPLVPEVYGISKLNDNGYELEINCFRDKEVTSKINDYLIEEFRKLNFGDQYLVNNSIEFANKVKNDYIADNEIMICYDFCSVFKKEDKKYWSKQIKKYFSQQTVDKTNKNIAVVLEELLNLSLDQNYIYFQGNIYEQMEGIPIGSKISSLLKSIYMYNLEHEDNASEWFPRIWYRCDDKVFTVQQRDKPIEEFDNVAITKEDNNGSIPFLDILVRREKNKFKFSIYRKSMDLERYIIKDSCHSDEEKHFWLKKLIQRFKSIPMDTFDSDEEWSKIISIAEFNGYDTSFCETILKLNNTIKDEINQDSENIIYIPFYPPLSNQIQVIMRKQNIEVKFTNFGTTIDILLPEIDMVKDLMKAGVYKIKCSCGQIYIGETKLSLKIRKTKHLNTDTAVTKHLEANESHETREIKLLKICDDKDQSQAWESFYLYKNVLKYGNEKILNEREAFVPSPLYEYC